MVAGGMIAWVPVTLAAAVLQTWRTALQQRLRSSVSVGTASFVRYIYAVPVGAVLLGLYLVVTRQLLPAPTVGFVLGCVVAGSAQIIGTALLIMAFGYRNFIVGTAYSKTDAVQAALVSTVVFGEVLAPLALLGVGIGLIGVVVLSLAGRGLDPRTLLRATVQPAALCGIGAGTGLGMAGIGIKAATQALAVPDPVLAALSALVVTNLIQTVLQGGWMAWREPDGLVAAIRGWRQAALVGALSAGGSACWFTAFAIAPVALVRTLGQVEVVFTLLFSRYYLRESLRGADVAGLLLVVIGVAVVLVSR